jgi:23S rRNA (uracil1939-C5)-methyltransferase
LRHNRQAPPQAVAAQPKKILLTYCSYLWYNGFMEKNEALELEITGITLQGDGIGRVQGMPVFVPGVCPGDRIRCLILKTKPAETPKMAFAKCLELLAPAPGRVDAKCEAFPRCGGCAFRCLAYEQELALKQREVQETLRRIGGVTAPVLPIVAAQPERYRNKAMLPFTVQQGRIHAGFYARHSHRVVCADDCMLQPALFTQLANTICQWAQAQGCSVYHESTGKGLLRHIYLRQTQGGAQVMVCLVINGLGVPRADILIQQLRAASPAVKSIVLNHNTEDTNVVLGARETLIWGAGQLEETLCGLRFALGPQAFFQVNPVQAQRLYAIATEYANLQGGERVLDLYCGTGTVGLAMARQCEELVGVEVVPQAVENARRNAAANGIANARFLCMDAAKAAQSLAAEGWKPNVVAIDPPRKGCDPALLRTVAGLQPERVVYISCDPATLARDLALLAELRYATMEVAPVDMFPRTGHVEAVAHLRRA